MFSLPCLSPPTQLATTCVQMYQEVSLEFFSGSASPLQHLDSYLLNCYNSLELLLPLQSLLHTNPQISHLKSNPSHKYEKKRKKKGLLWWSGG